MPEGKRLKDFAVSVSLCEGVFSFLLWQGESILLAQGFYPRLVHFIGLMESK